MSIQRVFIVVAGCAVILTMLGGVEAHHSVVGYDREEPVTTIEGVITEVGWRNPHPYLVWEASSDDGSAVTWTGELTGPIVMVSRWGMNRNSVRSGDEVAITGWPAIRGTPQILVQKIVVMREDGSVVIDFSEQFREFSGGSR